MQHSRAIPQIDPSVKYVGVSKLRELKAEKLRSLEDTLVIQENEKPLAVVLSYEQFMQMQQERNRILATLETVFTSEGREMLVAALLSYQEGRVKTDAEVRGKTKKGSDSAEK